MKGRLAAALAAAVLLGVGIAVAVGGAEDNALISKSYLENTFLPALTDHLAQRAEKDGQSTYDKAAEKLKTLGDARVKEAADQKDGQKGLTTLSVQEGDLLNAKPGSAILLYSGQGKLTQGALSDVTAGASLAVDDSLSAAHRYIVTGETDAVLTFSQGGSLGRQGSVELSQAGGKDGAGAGAGTGGGEKALPFADVGKDQWFYDAVAFVYEKGYFSGVSADAFAPDASMDRAMVATVLYRASGSDKTYPETGFDDVPVGQWYSNAIAWAASAGVVNGMGEGIYAPSQSVTREQLVTMLYRYEKDYCRGDAAETGDLMGFPDAGSISSWAKTAMSWAVGAKLLQGRNTGHLDPAGTATRAEVAAILQRFAGRN